MNRRALLLSMIALPFGAAKAAAWLPLPIPGCEPEFEIVVFDTAYGPLATDWELLTALRYAERKWPNVHRMFKGQEWWNDVAKGQLRWALTQAQKGA